MKAALIYKKEDALINRSFIDWFKAEAKQFNLTFDVILTEDYKESIVHNEYDFIINRSRQADISYDFKAKNIPVFNSPFITEIFNDKYKTHKALKKLNIPMQETILYDERKLLEYPFVIKPIDGHGGQDVKLIESESDWLKYRPKYPNNLIAQSAKNIQFGKDLRVYVIGNDITAAILRENKQDFRANYSLGGKVSLYPLNEKETMTIKQIIKAYEFDYVGIDFLFHHDGTLVFNEVEDAVGARMLSKLTDINIVKKYLEYILTKKLNQTQ